MIRKHLLAVVSAVNFAMFAPSLSYADDPVIEPIPFAKVGIQDDDLAGKFHLITGSISGADILVHGESACLVFVGRRTNHDHDFVRYSFNFDGRPASKYANLTKAHLGDLLAALRNPGNYADDREFEICGKNPDEVQAPGKEYDEVWAQDLALEIADIRTFVRIYFDKDFTRCYYVSSSGERGQDWKISEGLGKILRSVAKESEGKWIEIPKSHGKP